MKLKKNTFVQGAFIATLGIVISKILGIIYVIPFYAIIGDQGGALYGYAYNIYSIFLGISQAGLPLAMSKIISEYSTLGLPESQEKAFKIGKRILTILGIVCFLILFIFASEIAKLIIGDVTGGNSIEDITYVIRAISFSILIVPILSVYRGYFQGHRYMAPTSISQILEQLIRVIIIIVGSYITLKVFDLPLKYAVGLALFGATIGSLASAIYLMIKLKKNKKKFVAEEKEEVVKSTKEITIQIFSYALPFIMADVCKSLYNSVDTFIVVKTLTNDLGYLVKDAESIMGFISTWGNKLNMIVIAIGTGFTSSLLPNLTVSLVKKDKKDINLKINQTYQILTFITLPMTVGLSFLAEPVWNLFYGSSFYGPKVFAFSIFTAFVTVLLSTSTTIVLTLKEYKILFIALISGLVTNAIFDAPLMRLLHSIGIPAYYGATLSTILGNLLSVAIILIFLKKKYDIKFKETFKKIAKIIASVTVMYLVILAVKQIIPFANTRMFSIVTIMLYAIIGMIIYCVMANLFNLFNDIFEKRIMDKIKTKLKLKKGWKYEIWKTNRKRI